MIVLGAAAIVAGVAAGAQPPDRIEPPPRDLSPLAPGQPAAEAMAEVARAEIARQEQRRRERDLPAEKSERESSRRAHRGLGRARARALAEQRFARSATAPALRPFAGADRVQVLNPFTARVSREGQHSVVVSNVPLAVDDGPGAPAPLDLGLERRADVFVAVSGLPDIQFPARLQDGLALPDGIVIRHGDASDVLGEELAGSVFYPSAENDVDVIARPTASGVELFDVLRSEESPEELVLTVDAPGDVVLRNAPDPDEGIDVVRDGRVVGRFGAPAALAADGMVVEVKTEIDGATLRMLVEHRASDVRYPILVDPPYTPVSETYNGGTSCDSDPATTPPPCEWGLWNGRAGWYFEANAPTDRFYSSAPKPGDDWLGRGYTVANKTLTPRLFNDGEYAYWRYRSVGQTRIVQATVRSSLAADAGSDLCLFSGISGWSNTGGYVWEGRSALPGEVGAMCGDTEPNTCCGDESLNRTATWTVSGRLWNNLLSGIYVKFSKNRRFFVHRTHEAFIELWDDEFPAITANVPPGWTSQPNVTATASDAGTGVAQAIFNGTFHASTCTGSRQNLCEASVSSARTYPEGVSQLSGSVKDGSGRTALYGRGLRAQYWDNDNFTGYRVDKTDAVIDSQWGWRSPDPALGNSSFSARWEGRIKPPTTGTYTFYVKAEATGTLWINGQQVAATDKGRENSGTITLTGGTAYDLKYDYTSFVHDTFAELRWSGPGVTKQIVPADVLYPPASAPQAATEVKVDTSGPQVTQPTGAFMGTAPLTEQPKVIDVSAIEGSNATNATRRSGVAKVELWLKKGTGAYAPADEVAMSGTQRATQPCPADSCPYPDDASDPDLTFDPRPLSDGKYTVKVRFTDQVGNFTDSVEDTVVVDHNAPPAPTLTHDPTDLTTRWHKDVRVKTTVTATDPGSGIKYVETSVPLTPPTRQTRQIAQTCVGPQCPSPATYDFMYGPGSTEALPQGPLPEGRNKMMVRSSDNTNRLSPWTEWDFRVDRTPPTQAPSGTLWNARGTVIGYRPFALNVQASEGTAAANDTDVERAKERSGAKKIEVFSKPDNQAQTRVAVVDTACPLPGNCTRNLPPWNVDTTGLAKVGYDVTIRSEDQVGNFTTQTFRVTIDSQAPGLTLSGGTTQPIFNPPADLRIDADDRVAGANRSGIESIEVKVDGVRQQLYPRDCSATPTCQQTWGIDHDLNSGTWSDGPHTVDVIATDEAANSTTKTQKIEIDRNAPATPTLTHDANVAGWHKASDPRASTRVASTDAGSGIAYLGLSVPWKPATFERQSRHANQTCTPRCPASAPHDFDYGPSTSEALPSGPLPEGRNKMISWAGDNSGKSSPWAVWDYRVDRSGPDNTPSGSAYDARGTVIGRRRQLTFALTAKDGDAALSDTDIERARERSGARKIDFYTLYEDPAKTPPEWLRVPRAGQDVPCNPAGNCSRSGSWTWDPSDPAIWPAGTYQLIAVSEDMVGYTTETSFKLTIDKDAPTVELSGPATQPVEPGDRLHIEATDRIGGVDGSGVRSLEVKVDGLRHTLYTQDCSSGACPQSWSKDHDFNGSIPEGSHEIEVVATDDAGNTGRATRSVYVVDLAAVERSKLGLEDFLHYHTTQTGAGSALHVNAATGNVVWHSVPVVNPGRGLSSVVNLTYNSHDRGGFLAQQLDAEGSQLVGSSLADLAGLAYGEAGHGFSLGISGLTRLNEPLVGTLTAMVTGRIEMTDPDGTNHVFTDDNHDGIFDEPPGVNLRLRRFSDSDPLKKWAITRPDGVTSYFDAEGYATTVQDRNGNVIEFEYETYSKLDGTDCPPVPLPTLLCARRVVKVVDAAGVADPAKRDARSLEVEYYDGGLLTLPDGVTDVDPELARVAGRPGRIKTIVDHTERLTEFEYDQDGYLTLLKQGAVRTGPGSEDTSDERTFELGYSGTAPNRLLTSIEDPNGNATEVEYESPAAGIRPVGRRADAVIDRRGTRWSYTFSERTDATGMNLTVSDPTGRSTEARTDSRGRPDRLVDGRGTATLLAWEGDDGDDNNVTTLTEAAGTPDEAVTHMAYNKHGQLTSQTDAEDRVTTIDYHESRGTQVATTGVDAEGAWVSDPERMTPPELNWTHFRLDPSDDGNVLGRQVKDQPEATTSYGTGGVITSEADEVGNVTEFEDFDDNGLPRTEIDERNHRWGYTYDALGNVLTQTDPRGVTTSDPDDFRSEYEYDAFDRVVRSVTPRRSELDQYTIRSATYDANGNVTSEIDGNGDTSTRAYTAMDEVRRESSPPAEHFGEQGVAAETSTLEYDIVGRLQREIAPNGEGGDPGDYEATFEYDAADNRTVERRHARTAPAATPAELVTSMAYDRRGNVTGEADPRHNAEGGDPVANAAATASQRWSYAYDGTDNRTAAVEDPAGLGLRTEYAYDLNQNLEREISPRGFAESRLVDFTTTYGYDTNDLVISVNRGDRTTRYERRGDGRITAKVTPNGVASSAQGDFTTTYAYYPTGELQRWMLPRAEGQYAPGGRGVEYERNEVGDPIRITDPRGNSFTNGFLDTGELRVTGRPSWWMYCGPNVIRRADPLDPVSQGRQAEMEVRERSLDEWLHDGANGELPATEGEGDFGEVDPAAQPNFLPRAGTATLTYDGEMQLTGVTDAAAQTTTLHRNPIGRVVELEQPIGHGLGVAITTTAFDRNGNPRRVVDAEGHATTLEYDEYDRRIVSEAPGSAVAAPEPDLPGAPATRRSEYQYDANGNLLEELSPRGLATVEAYDAVDRPARAREPDGATTTYDYDAAGNVVLERRPLGNAAAPVNDSFATRTEYDQFDAVVRETDGLGNETRFTYDRNGNTTRIDEPGAGASPGVEPRRRITERAFDGRDLLWKETLGAAGDDPRTSITEYDPNGNLRRIVNPAGVDESARRPHHADEPTQLARPSAEEATHATVYTYDPDNLLDEEWLPVGTAETDSAQHARTRARDARGRTTSITAPPAGGTQGTTRVLFTYYENGWIRSSTEQFDPLDGTGPEARHSFTYEYDRRGNQTAWRSNSGRESLRTYYPSGELRQRVARRGTPESIRTYTFGYNANGSLLQMVDHQLGRTTNVELDEAERVSVVNEAWTTGKDTLFVYDADDNVRARRTDGTWHGTLQDGTPDFRDGKLTTFGYDALDREITMSVAAPGRPQRDTSRTYWPSGEERTRTKSNLTVEESYYHDDGRLALLRRDPAGTDLTVEDQVYTYDRNANITGDEGGTYQFNARNQLIGWIRPAEDGLPARTVEYVMTPTGAIDESTEGGVTTDHVLEGDRLIAERRGSETVRAYDYDTDGNLTHVDGGEGDRTRYHYDAFGRMDWSSTADDGSIQTRFGYDGLDRRDFSCAGGSDSECAGVTRLDMGYIGMTEALSLERVDGGHTRTYDYTSNLERLGQDDMPTGDPANADYADYALGGDGSVMGLEDGDGGVAAADSYRFDPFGKEEAGVTLSARASANPFRFEGFYYDHDTETYDMKARPYRPEIGRFLTQDRFESADGDFNLEADILTEDRYAFAGGNPVNNVEWDGHQGRAPKGGPGLPPRPSSSEAGRGGAGAPKSRTPAQRRAQRRQDAKAKRARKAREKKQARFEGRFYDCMYKEAGVSNKKRVADCLDDCIACSYHPSLRNPKCWSCTGCLGAAGTAVIRCVKHARKRPGTKRRTRPRDQRRQERPT